MAKGKRMASNISSHKHKTNRLKFFIIIFILIIICSISYYFINVFKNHNLNTTDEYCKVAIKKSVEGIDSLKISSLNIYKYNSTSIIQISLSNVSNTSISKQDAHLYLYDSNNKTIFGTSLKLPSLDANSSIVFNIACSNDIENVADYKIVSE
ncbi:MAG: hypothetical protein ACI4VC_03825 [Clostridia bacterium]